MANAGLLLYRIVLMVLGGLPLLVVSYALLSVWMDPLGIEEGGWVRAAAVLVLLEFILLHSAAFMSVGPLICSRLWQRLGWFMGFGIVYGGVFIAIARWSQGKYVFWMLFAVFISRLMTLVFLRDKRGTIMMLQRSAVGMIVLLLTAIVVFLPLPPLGLTEEIRFAAFGVADDLLSEYPHRTIAWGVLYFLLMALVEISVAWNLPAWTDEKVDEMWKALKK
jgi:hypothetical protein